MLGFASRAGLRPSAPISSSACHTPLLHQGPQQLHVCSHLWQLTVAFSLASTSRRRCSHCRLHPHTPVSTLAICPKRFIQVTWRGAVLPGQLPHVERPHRGGGQLPAHPTGDCSEGGSPDQGGPPLRSLHHAALVAGRCDFHCMTHGCWRHTACNCSTWLQRLVLQADCSLLPVYELMSSACAQSEEHVLSSADIDRLPSRGR